MSNSKLNIALAVTIGILFAWLFIIIDKKNKKIKELEKDINENVNINIEIKEKLKDLIQNHSEVDPKIANELGQIIALLDIKQDASAIMKLAKIIENLLKELFKKESEIKIISNKNNHKTPAFADYLEHAMNKKIISKEDFHLMSIMKLIRNEEAHEIGIKKEKSRIVATLISGIGIILSLCSILKKKSIENVIV